MVFNFIKRAHTKQNPELAIGRILINSTMLANEMIKKDYDPNLIINAMGIAIFNKGEPLRPYFNPEGSADFIDKNCWTIGNTILHIKKVSNINGIINVCSINPNTMRSLLVSYANVNGNMADERFSETVIPFASFMTVEFKLLGYI